MTDEVDGDDVEHDEAEGAEVHEVDEVYEVDEIGSDDAGNWREEYLDEQLAAHDDSDEPVPPGKAPMSRFRHGSLGVTLGAAMSGLGNVLEPRKQEDTAVILQHDEPDHSRDPVELHLDRDDPGASVMIIRKWVDEHPDRSVRDEPRRSDGPDRPEQ